MVTKKIKIKDKDGIVTEVDIGAEAKNISEDAAHRFTSDTEKEKLNGIDEGANKYTHPTTSGNKHIPSGGSTGKILGWKADGEAQWVDDKNTTYSAFKGATSAAAGGTGLVPAPAAGDQAKFLSGDGTWDSVNDMAPTFTQAETRANIASGEKVPTLFGKIAKWFTDLKTGAFATVVNNLTTTAASTVLDGRQGKALNDKITAINSALVYVNTADVKDGSNFNKNFLNIGTAAQSEKTQRSLFLIEADTADQWASVPPGLITTSVSVGIREVFWYSSTVVMVRVTEIHPKPGTMYMRTYNNGSWNDGGWKTITPQ